jgi:hypothetical protein
MINDRPRERLTRHGRPGRNVGLQSGTGAHAHTPFVSQQVDPFGHPPQNVPQALTPQKPAGQVPVQTPPQAFVPQKSAGQVHGSMVTNRLESWMAVPHAGDVATAVLHVGAIAPAGVLIEARNATAALGYWLQADTS